MSFQKIDHDDAIRPGGRACILVFGYNPLELGTIKTYAANYNDLEVIEVKANMVHNTLKQLIDETDNISPKETVHQNPAVIINALSSAELNHFVHNFRALGLKSPLFAMVTETSINWKFTDLIDDLLEERAMFMKMREQQQNN